MDPRQRRTHQTVLAAARTVLRRDGVHGASIDAIASEAGVARSTVYRNWPSRDALLDDAIGEIARPAPPAGDGDPIERLAAVVEHLATCLDDTEWGRTLPAIVAAIDDAPELAARYRQFVEGRRSDVDRLVRDAIASGALPAGVTVGDLIDDLVGPLFYRRLVRRVATPPAWARAHVARTIRANAVAPGPSGSGSARVDAER